MKIAGFSQRVRSFLDIRFFVKKINHTNKKLLKCYGYQVCLYNIILPPGWSQAGGQKHKSQHRCGTPKVGVIRHFMSFIKIVFVKYTIFIPIFSFPNYSIPFHFFHHFTLYSPSSPTKWCLLLYPNGNQEDREGFVSLYLYRWEYNYYIYYKYCKYYKYYY